MNYIEEHWEMTAQRTNLATDSMFLLSTLEKQKYFDQRNPPRGPNAEIFDDIFQTTAIVSCMSTRHSWRDP